jgi:uncharacterized membrane protein YoaK (UPF0700 family)
VAAIDEHDVGVAPRTRDGLLPALRRLSPSTVRDLLLVGLTLSSGAVDAISFLGLEKVFTAFMTGNVVFLGLGVAGAGGPDVLRVSASLAAFAVGVLLAVQIVRHSKGSGLWPRRVSITLGIAVLAQAGFLAGWLATSGRPGTAAGDLLVGLSALAMGLQSGAVLSLGVKGVFTTAATATVIMLVSDVAAWKESAAERRRLAGVLLGLFAGAAAGGFLLVHARAYAPVLPLFATVLVIAVASLALEPPRVLRRVSGPRPGS